MKNEVALPELGRQLKALRKQCFPKDDQKTFAFRVGVSRATYQKMEKGDLSVSMQSYYAAAERLGIASRFTQIFIIEKARNLFEEIGL